MTDQRLEYEADFHTDTETRLNARNKINRFTKNLGDPYIFAWHLVEENKSILDYGLGEGWDIKNLLNKNPRKIVGIDISLGMVKRAKKEVSNHNISFFMMNGENLVFKDESFDIVYGAAILHHLDLDKATNEIYRVLKPGGIGIFVEPLGHNFFINWFRKKTPDTRTPYEHPLRVADFKLFSTKFSKFEHKEFYFSILPLLPLRLINNPSKVFSTLISISNKLDNLLFKIFPVLRRYSWIAVLHMKK